MIVVYGIAKDEAKFAQRFAESVRDADQVVICDTGSSDATPDILAEHGVTVHEISVSPWRFDLARNMALTHVPAEATICVSMDLDEVALPGWRETIERYWTPETTILRYPFIHSWQDREQTVPKLSVWGFKVHSRHGYIWRYPIHEILERTEPGEVVAVCPKEILRHYPDPEKQERWSRLGLHEQWAREYPDNQRAAYLYGRELWFHRRYAEAIAELRRFLSLSAPYCDPYDDPEGIIHFRATACRIIAHCLAALGHDVNEIAVWMIRAVAENPSQREPWIRLAEFWLAVEDYASAYACARRGLAITDRARSLEVEEDCWTKAEALRDLAWDLLSSSGRTE